MIADKKWSSQSCCDIVLKSLKIEMNNLFREAFVGKRVVVPPVLKNSPIFYFVNLMVG